MRFLYYIVTELRGRRERVRAGNGKAGTSVATGEQANPLLEGKT